MNGLPDYQPQKLAEGEYKFIIADFEKKRYERTGGSGGETITVKFTFKVEVPRGGYRRHIESFGAWEERYRDLLLAIGAREDEEGIPHLSQTSEVIGSCFRARIRHEKDKDDPSKTWARVADIEIPEKDDSEPPDDAEYEETDVPAPKENGSTDEDEVPF